VNSNQITSNAQQTSGLFGKSQLRTCHGFDTLRLQAEQRVTSLINEALNHTYDALNERKLVEIFDDISNELCCVADLAEFVRTTHPSMDYREAANTTFSHISQLVETLNTNQRLYTKLSESLKHNEHMNGKLKMDECDKRVCKLFLIDFEQSGIHLDETIRNQFVQTNNELVDVLTKFQAESQTASKVSVANVHPRFKNMVKYYSDPIVVESMFINSEDELMREFVYKTYLQRNDLQETYFRNVLAKRRKLANLCAFETFAHRANQSMMMENPENVVEFLNKCSKSIWTKAENEFNKMRDFKRKYLNSPMPLMQWDVPLVTNKIKRQMFDIDKSQYMSYLSLGSCIEGLNMIVNHLYK
jgi:intermediate peptidase